ncbi:M14 family zinc carboxypeptidase [Arthrobacter sp. 18067]|uniref:M14 family zinc carboxypeptidase n=1 Tax=Arthrobacter sp. 18067 TaxID=2681413 RepID=UPI00228657B9|nr:M14 family zinc carboxypeptidase [Arthrobacter sp. 18067]
MDLANALCSLASEPRFPTIREIDARVGALARAFPSRVQAETIGLSREGRPLHQLTVGSGARHAVVIGMPHPNEPSGALGALGLAELLSRDDALREGLGLTWHILPCADPDGGVLNESWFAGPFSRQSYAGGIYRPPRNVDFEWTFHRSDLAEPGLPPIPETRAVMGLLDDVRPELLVSMHNTEAGGLYANVTEAYPSIVSGFRETSRLTGLPVDQGFPEAPADILAPGIFHEKPLLEGGVMISSTDYAAKYGTFGVVVEAPLWNVPSVADTCLTQTTAAQLYGSIEKERNEVRGEYFGWLERLDRHTHLDTARWRAVHAGSEHVAQVWHPPVDAGQRLTVAEVSTVKRFRDLERLRLAGHIVAAIADSPECDNESGQAVQRAATVAIERWVGTAITGVFCGLEASVAAHVGIALASAKALAGRS